MLRDRMAVTGPRQERPKDEEVERPAQEVDAETAAALDAPDEEAPAEPAAAPAPSNRWGNGEATVSEAEEMPVEILAALKYEPW